MQVKILLFGIIADIIGESSLYFELEKPYTVYSFKEQFILSYPLLKNYSSFAIAVNEEYALNETEIQEKQVIAIIPPVSGG